MYVYIYIYIYIFVYMYIYPPSECMGLGFKVLDVSLRIECLGSHEGLDLHVIETTHPHPPSSRCLGVECLV